MLELLQVQNLRNLAQLQLNHLKTINLILGPNGAGKTSVLEAIHLLGTGRSFRSHKIANVVQDEQSQLTVFGRLYDEQQIGVSRTRDGEYSIRINREPQDKLSGLAHFLPVRVIAPDSYLMLTTGAKLRRQFLDFSVFHVEHEFSGQWLQYQRLLKQRNAQLKQASEYQDLSIWDKQLIPLVSSICQYRQAVFEQLEPYLVQTQSAFLPQYAVQYQLKSGLPDSFDNEAVASAYVASFRQDSRYGHTSFGPHKSDLQVLIDGADAHEIISRGELKMLVISMVLAQVQYLLHHTERTCYLLIDDLTSELDHHKQGLLLDTLAEIPKLQLFISSIQCPDYFQDKSLQNTQMFHVKHGELQLD